MRNIAFRVWDRTAAAWHYFSLRPLDHLSDLAGREVDEDSLTQDTDLKDKNGKNIFEGDILQDRLGSRCVVGFDSARFMLTRSHGAAAWPLSSNSNHYEVVGNIVESPKLID